MTIARYSTAMAASALMVFALPAANAENSFLRAAEGSKCVLDGSQEVPPVSTFARGIGIVQFAANLRSASLQVSFTDLTGDFTRLHLHCNVAGQNGPVAAGVIDFVAIGADNSEVATLGSNQINATIMDGNFPSDGGACGISSVRDLFNAINEGGIYYNLHTKAFPSGEIRCQVGPTAPLTPATTLKSKH